LVTFSTQALKTHPLVFYEVGFPAPEIKKTIETTENGRYFEKEESS